MKKLRKKLKTYLMGTLIHNWLELRYKMGLEKERSSRWQRVDELVIYAMKTIVKKIFMEFQYALIVSA